MEELAIQFRHLQFLAHNAHNETGGASFFSDHEFFGALYPDYEQAYDALIERMLGLGEKFDIVGIHKAAVEKLEAEPNPEGYLMALLDGETELCKQIEAMCGHEEGTEEESGEDDGDAYASKHPSQGTMNLLAGLADASEQRQYKLRQRLL